MANIIDKRYAQITGRSIVYALLAIMALYYIMPLLIMILTSFKDLDEIREGNLFTLPASLNFDAWLKAWNTACTGVECNGLQPYFMNSVSIVVPAVTISTILGAMNGYIFSFWRFKGSDWLFGALLFGTFLPFQSILLPMSVTLGKMGLAGTIPGLIFVHIVYGTAFTTLFFRNFYVSVPGELIKAAKLDGASFWGIFFKILLPISTPIVVVTVIWQFTMIWNDFLFGVVFGSGAPPITVALNNIVNSTQGVKEYNVDMAAAMIAALPTILVYIVAGKYFIRGLTAGSVKG